MNKIYIKCLYLFFILLFLYNNICYATIATVTEENLNSALQKFVSSEANEENYSIKVENNIIKITSNNESYDLKYDLTDKPTFLFEVLIEKGMSYEKFKKQNENMVLPMVAYAAVANIQGVDFKDSTSYFLLSYLGEALKNGFDSSNSYVIVDDTNVSDGVTIDKTNTNTNTIHVSEFGERVMEYVNAIYSEKQIISDSEDINSYTLSIERKDVTDTSCRLVSTLSVNVDADFSKIIGYKDKVNDAFVNNDITKENADLVITLKVGQKCKIESNKEITGYEFSGNDCIELNDEKTEITATSVGIKNGYLYIGEEKKSIYITVEENTENSNLETITLKIDSKPELEPTDFNDEKGKEENKQENKETIKDNTEISSRLPQTGISNSKFFIGIILVVIIIVIGKKLKKLKEI